MRWLQERWVKKLFIISFSLIIFLLILSFGATLYLKKVLTHDKILEIVQRYSQQYLNRDMARVVEPGAFEIMVGGSSVPCLKGLLEVEA